MGLKDGLLADYDHEVASTRRLLERLPDARLDWKPHEKSMSLGALATHLGHILTWAAPILKESSFDVELAPPTPEPLASSVQILEYFDTTTARTRADMDRSDAEYAALWCLRRGGTEMFVIPRIAAFRAFVLHHIIHHRGQLSVYLRLNDIPVPPIYGPSADEQ